MTFPQRRGGRVLCLFLLFTSMEDLSRGSRSGVSVPKRNIFYETVDLLYDPT